MSVPYYGEFCLHLQKSGLWINLSWGRVVFHLRGSPEVSFRRMIHALPDGYREAVILAALGLLQLFAALADSPGLEFNLGVL